MNIENLSRLGSLLCAAITDYRLLHERTDQIIAIKEELNTASIEDHKIISSKYAKLLQSYTLMQSMLNIQYRNLQRFALFNAKDSTLEDEELTKRHVSLLLMDIEHLHKLPKLRTAILEINEVLKESGSLLDETLIMSGILKNGEIKV